MPDGLDKQRLAAQYGFALSFMKSSPELWNLFSQATKHNWAPDLFVAKLRDTKWFKHHSAAVRNAIMQEKSDPATYKAAVDQMFATVRDAWGSMFGEAGMNHKDMRAWAETAHRLGWTQAQLMDRMTASVNYRKMLKKNTLGGSAAELEGQISALLDAQGVKLGDHWKAAQIKRVLSGNDTVAGVQARVRDLAMREYKAFADQIQAGQTVREIADPYVQTMADLLELNPNEVDVRNELIQKAMKQTTEKGKPAAMDLNDFARAVRADPRWQFTDNARKEIASVVANLGQQFGVVA